MRSIELVVARFTEDVRWLRRVPRKVSVRLYNKGQPLIADPPRRRVNVMPLPNISREDYAYLTHIVQQYGMLSEITVFAQGRPFDHVPSFHANLRDIAYGRLPVDRFRWLGFIIDEDDAQGRLVFQNWSKNPDRELLSMDTFWQALWGESAPPRVTFYAGAHFAVTKEQIRSRPRSFYEKALSLCDTVPHAAHCFERTWDRIVGVNGIPETYRNQPKPIYLRRIRRLSAPTSGLRPPTRVPRAPDSISPSGIHFPGSRSGPDDRAVE